MQLNQPIWIALLLNSASAGTLRQTVAQHQSLNLLHSILDHLDLYDIFTESSNATFLAMTDTAIHFLADWGINLTEIDAELARDILKYHFLDGRYTSAALSHPTQELLAHSILRPPHCTNVSNGPPVKLQRKQASGSLLIQSGLQKVLPVIASDIHYDGGVIHTIDSNLVLPHNLSETTNVGGLLEFWRLIETSGLQVDLESLRDTTYFIPTNDAIIKSRSILGRLSFEQLASVIAYHAIPGKILYRSTIGDQGETHTTLHGDPVAVKTVADAHLLVNDLSVAKADVIVYGGVAHIIDDLLMPPGLISANVSSLAEQGAPQRLTWILSILTWPSTAEGVFYAGLAAVFCGLGIWKLLHWQERSQILDQSSLEIGGDSGRLLSRLLVKD